MTIRATLTPAGSGIKVYFMVFDVDDPSASRGPIDPRSDPTDNRAEFKQPESSATTILSRTTISSGIAEVDFNVTLQPGDNFKAVASLDDANFSGLEAKKEDGILARILDGEGGFLPNSDVAVTELLTVWRKFDIEVDSMGAPSGNDVTGTITAVAQPFAQPNRRRVTTDQTLNDSVNRFENGTLTSNSIDYNVVGNNTGANFKVTVDNNGSNVPQQNASFTLVDDDIMLTDIPAPDTSLLEDLFDAVYIVPVLEGGGSKANNNSNVKFAVNVEANRVSVGGQVNAGRSANYSSSLYWIGYIQGAFQGPKSKDEDPDTEGGTLGINASPNKGALIFHETIRDKDPSLGSRVTGHELGHQFGLGEADDGSIMDRENTGNTFGASDRNKIRKVSFPQ